MIVDDHEEIRASVSRLVRVWGHEVAVAARRPECALARGDLPARVRHRRPLIAGDERDRAGSSSASAVSSGAALSDRSHRLRGRGHPRRVPRRRFRCVSGQARRYPPVGETARKRPRGFRSGVTRSPRVHSARRRNPQESLTEENAGCHVGMPSRPSNNARWPRSLVAKRDHRIDSRRSPGRSVAGHERCDQQNDRRQRQRARVVRLHVEQK